MDVSILIPVHNCVRFTSACLDSLLPTLPAAKGATRCEILVYDDASTDETPELLSRHASRVRTIRGETRASFSINMNRLARESAGRYLVMLNNDTLLRPRWLDEMLAVVGAQSAAGIVGNLHLFPESNTRPTPGGCRVNHAGVVFDEELYARHLYEGLSERIAPVHATRQLQAVSAACWLVDAAHWKDMGGFDEQYVNGHEDIDACLRTREMGREVWYAGRSEIEHFGSSTPGRFDEVDQNHDRFMARWDGQFKSDLKAIVEADGIDWPKRSMAYRVARWIWRCPPARAVLGRLLASRFGIRCRGIIHRKLVSSR